MISLWKRVLPVVVLFLTFAAVIGPTLFFGPLSDNFRKSKAGRGSEEFEKLSAQLSKLELTLLHRLDEIERGFDSSEPRPIVSEGEELRLLQEISHHASKGDMEFLGQSLDRYLEKFGASENASLIEKMRHEVAAVGKPVPVPAPAPEATEEVEEDTEKPVEPSDGENE